MADTGLPLATALALAPAHQLLPAARARGLHKLPRVCARPRARRLPAMAAAAGAPGGFDPAQLYTKAD
jgi:hypothetical protein